MDAVTFKVVRIALELLGERAFSMLALVMTFGLTCWVMHDPTYERLGMAAFFAVAVYIPTLRWERKKANDAENA